MTAPVTEAHLRHAKDCAGDICFAACGYQDRLDPLMMRPHIAQAIADAEARGREAGIREAAALPLKHVSNSMLAAAMRDRILALLQDDEVKP